MKRFSGRLANGMAAESSTNTWRVGRAKGKPERFAFSTRKEWFVEFRKASVAG